MKKNYSNPAFSVVIVKEDLMLLSDTFVDVGGLWDDETPESPAE